MHLYISQAGPDPRERRRVRIITYTRVGYTCMAWVGLVKEVDISPAAGHDLQRYWSGNGDHVLNWAGCVGVNKLIMNIK